jgi:hypothetical protein
MKNVLFFLMLLMSAGCIQVAQFARDHIVTGPGMSKSVNHLKYKLIGTVGPDALWLENQYELRVKMNFDLLKFPTAHQLEDEFLFSKKEASELENDASFRIRNYFGHLKTITVITLKSASGDGRTRTFLLDAKTEHRSETLAERMVSAGYYYVNEDLARTSSHKNLMRLQEKAQRSRLGIWKNIKAYNPLYHD